MEENDFLKKFAFQFDETDPELISLESNYKDLDEWSSLIVLSLMAMADEEYGVKLTPDDFKNNNTVSDIFNVIKAKI